MRPRTSLTHSLAFRNLRAHAPRTTLSAIAVALGVMMIVAADAIASAIRNAGAALENAQNTDIVGDLLAGGLTGVGLVILLAAGFLIFNAFAMSVTQRRQQIGLLRSLGMTRWQVLGLLCIEALLTGGAGALLGLLAGPLVGQGLLRAMSALANVSYGQVSLSPVVLIAAPLAGIVLTLLAVLVPAWLATRISPLEALRESNVKRESINRKSHFTFYVLPILGLVILIALWTYLIIAPPGEWMLPPWYNIIPNLLNVVWLGGVALVTPWLVQSAARVLRRPLTRTFGAAGQLVADNLRRSPGRVLLTLGALAVGLTMIVSTTGSITFLFHVQFEQVFKRFHSGVTWMVMPFPFTDEAGKTRIDFQVLSEWDMEAQTLPADVVADLERLAEGRAHVITLQGTAAPEIALIPGTPVFVMDAEQMRTGNFFEFYEGDWEHALPLMETGCGLLLTPRVAAANDVWLYDTLTVTGRNGPVECVVAGIGTNAFLGNSVIGAAAAADFVAHPDQVYGLRLDLYTGTDADVFAHEIDARIASETGLVRYEFDQYLEDLGTLVDQMKVMLNGPVLLAILAAALGVINTTMMSVSERARELALLRAVGATARQVKAIVTGEAALLGVLGGALGLIAGVGSTVITVVASGGNVTGIHNLPLWPTAWTCARPALFNGLVGLLAAPIICAGAAFLVVRGPYSVKHSAFSIVGSPFLRTTHYEIRLALHNLRAHAARTILSALAVALGATMLVSTSVFRSGIEAAWTAGANKFAFITEISNLTFGGVGLMMLGAAGFLIYNAFAMSVMQQQRQIGMLRSLGMTRAQVLRLVLVEALFTGGLGTVLGVLGGPLVGTGILNAMAYFGVETGKGSASPGSIVLAVTMGLGISLLSALVPARRAARLSPLEALRESESANGRISKSANQQIGNPLISLRPRLLSTVYRLLSSRLTLGLGLLIPLWTYLAIAPPGTWTGYHQPWDYILSAVLMFVWWIGFVLVTPALLGVATRGIRAILRRLSGGMGRLLGDNLSRAPERLHLTALTFAVGVLMMVTTGGFVSFGNDVMVGRIAAQALREQAWYIYPFNRVEGLGQLQGFQADSPPLEPAIVAEIEQLAAGRAVVEPLYMVAVPEISSPFPGFPSMVTLDPEQLTRPGRFHLVEGDWDTALPLLREGCGVLVSPAIAARYGAGVGDPITVTGRTGPVTCTVAATGAGGFAPMSLIGPGGFDLFVAPGKSPDSLQVRPLPDATDADIAALDADLHALAARYGDDRVFISRPEDELESITGTSDQLVQIMNGLLLLAIGAGALGSVNTTLVSILERRRELTLLRSLGATRRQIAGLIVGESAVTGLLGALLGLLAGWGTIAIYALTYGGVTFGLVDLPLWTAVAEITWPALRGGLPGLVAAPVLAGLAAWLVVRSPYAVERSAYSVKSKRATPHGLRLGLRERFTLGAAALLLILMLSLVAAVTGHQEQYMDDGARQLATLMVQSQAQALELGLPDDATTLDLTALDEQMDAEQLLALQSLLEDVGDTGLAAYTVTDRDNIVLLSLNPREVGTLAPPLENTAEAVAESEREDELWRIHATAPVRNAAGDAVGAVQMTFDLAWVQDALRDLRGTLWAVGGGISLLALALTWFLATPLVRATQQLAAHATGIALGEYVPFARPARRSPWAWITARTSLRTRFIIALTLIILLLVGSLEVVTLPIQRRHVEKTLLDGAAATVEWLGEIMSEALGNTNFAPGDLGTDFSLDQMLAATNTMDWGQLQALAEQSRPESLAYIALVDADGVVLLSDQLALVGETVDVPATTETTAQRWRNEDVWVISTPLTRGRGGERVGALQIGMRRAEVETFLDQSRMFFRLAGLIAILAGVLLAQVIGGAVAGPVQTLAKGTRRVAAGDLDVRFDVKSRDEVAQLAAAYNAMVAGLREREWLRDMFGRFVSQEVAEAIRTGQVRLEGENRVVSVLFCDIRGFTTRSERHTPQEIVALLNEYLPVVVEAAQHHQGTVNKFGGDSTLVIYGAPRPLQESAYQAVLTALEMRTNLARLNTQLAARGDEPIRIGVGINTGVVLAGAVGPHERQEYTVIGDTVNLASRIEALNKEYPKHDVLISGATYEALGSHRAEFAFADLGEVGIRGKSGPVQVWAVMGQSPPL